MSLVMKKLILSSDPSEILRLCNIESTTGWDRPVNCGTAPTGSRPLSTYVVALGKNVTAYKKSGPLNMYSIVWCFSGSRASENARIFESVPSSTFPNMELKWRACSCHIGLLVSEASDESAAGGTPARKRAASSGAEVSALRAGAAAKVSAPARRRVAINLGVVEGTFRGTGRETSDAGACEYWREA